MPLSDLAVNLVQEKIDELTSGAGSVVGEVVGGFSACVKGVGTWGLGAIAGMTTLWQTAFELAEARRSA